MGDKRYNVDIFVNLKTGEVVRGQKELDRLRAEEIKSVRQAEGHKQTLVEISARAQVNTVAQALKANERAKDREAQTFGRVESHKQRLVEISARSQSNAVLQTMRATEKAKEREVQAFARQESHKQKLAEISARSQARAYEIELRRIARASQQTAKDSAFSFTNLLGANFFGNLAAGMVRGFVSQLLELPNRTAKIAGDLRQEVANSLSIKPTLNTDEVFRALNDMQARVPQSAQQLASGLYNIFSSIEVSQADALKLLEQFARGATAARTDAETFGTAILGVMNAYKLSVNEASHVSDVFFNTVAAGVVTGSELATNLGIVTQAAKNAGVGVDELGGLIAGVTKEGGSAAQNINNLANTLMKLPTKETGKALEGLGISLETADKKTRPILDVISDLKVKLDQFTPLARARVLQDIFPDAQARTGLQTLLSQLEFVRGEIENNKQSADSTSAAYDVMANTYATAAALQEGAINRLHGAIGDLIIQSPATIEALKIVTEQFREQTEEINNSDSAVNDFAEDAVIAWNKVKANAIPAVATVANLARSVSSSMGVVVTAAVGGILWLLESVADAFLGVGNTIVNGVKVVINGVTSALQAAGIDKLLNLNLGKLEITAPAKTNFGSEFFFGKTKEALDDVVKSIQKVAALDEQRAVNALRIDFAIEGRRQERDRQARADRMSGVDRTGAQTESDARLTRANELRDSVLGGRTNTAGLIDTAPSTRTGKRKAEQKIIDDADKWRISELRDIQEWFKLQTGRTLPVSVIGQSPFHNRKGLDHRNAADVGLHPNSPEGRALMAYLRANDIPHRGLTEADKARGVIMTRPHIHIGEASQGFGKNTLSLGATRGGRADDSVLMRINDQVVRVLPELIYRFQAQVAAMREKAFPKDAPATTTGDIAGVEKLTRQLNIFEQARLAVDDQLKEQARELFIRQSNFALELSDVWLNAANERKHRELDTIKSIEQAEATLHQMRIENADKESVENRRKGKVKDEEVDLSKRLQNLGDDLANIGANQGLKNQIALMEELIAVRRADFDAIEDQIRAQVRLEDASILHTEQVRANVLDHIANQKTVTEAFGDSFTSIYSRVNDAIYKGVSRLTGGIKELDGILASVISQITNRLFQRFLDAVMPSGNGNSRGGFNLGSVFSQASRSGNGFSNVAPAFNATNGSGSLSAAGVLAQNGGLFGSFGSASNVNLFGGSSTLTAPQSITIAGQQRAEWQRQIMGEWASGGIGTSVKSGGMLSGLAKTLPPFAPMLPLLGLTGGLSLGAGLGRGSRLGGLLGGFGGGVLGAAGGLLGAGLLSPGIFSVGIGGASGGALSGLAPLLPILTNPFLIGAAALAIPAAILIGRSAERRRNETQRNQLSTDLRTQLYSLISQVRSNRIDGQSALAQYQDARSQYVERVSKLDSKTRNNSMLWLERDLEKQVLPLLTAAIADREKRKERAAQFSPTFATGGGVWSATGGAQPALASMLGLDRFGSGLVSGSHFDKKDDRLVRVSKREVILTPEHWKPIESYLSAAGVRGFQEGGAVDEAAAQRIARSSMSPSSSSPVQSSSRPQINLPEINMPVTVILGKQDATRVVMDTTELRKFEDRIADIMEDYVERMRESSPMYHRYRKGWS